MTIRKDEHESRVGQEKSFLESLVMNAAAPIFVLDKEHRILYWNRAFERLTGFLAKEMIGTSRHWEAFYQEKRSTLADVVLDNAYGVLDELYSSHRASQFVEGAIQAEGWITSANSRRLYSASMLRLS